MQTQVFRGFTEKLPGIYRDITMIRGRHLTVCLWVYSLFLTLAVFFNFLIFFTQSVGPLGRGISPSQGRCLHTEQHKTQNKRTQTSIPWAGIEPTIPVFELAKTVYALDRAATVIGQGTTASSKMPSSSSFMKHINYSFFYCCLHPVACK
jgi:hypothetical protein